ncbi:hypothetical protein [Halobaculum gomorrense]|uniref:Uncharacterized protein n=1 Tax=Halobaculum gomorrense TaxID=43928 RepID=A0A1M5JD02_9EURY|nr:hypothetical protein [Halobaculum gomorrense]SHG37893.1 hypothetical protein SAMN05443636_0033 [Halobaculum gomorrense]
MTYDPLSPEMVIEGHVMTWDGRSDPVTVVDQGDETLLVETDRGEQFQLAGTSAGLIIEETGEHLENARVIGMNSWRMTNELTSYFEETLEKYASTTISAVEFTEQNDLSIDEMNYQLSTLLGDARSTITALRSGNDTWIICDSGFYGRGSQSELADALSHREHVEAVAEEDNVLVVTFDGETTAVPLLVAHLVYHAGWAIVSVTNPYGEDPLTMTLTDRPEATTR